MAATAAVLAGATGAAQATEGGGSDYALGVETQFTGIMNAPGLYEYLFVTHSRSDHSRDNAGHDNARLAYFGSTVNAVAQRLLYVYPGVSWFGASVETRAAFAVPDIDVSVGILRPTPPGPLDLSGHDVGIADPSLFPAILGWHAPTYHQTLGAELIFPIGQYSSTERVNPGRNYFAVAPAYTFTWFALPQWDISGKLRYEVNAVNPSTHYHSGHEASFELGSNLRFSDKFLAGIAGYAYRQVTNDRQNGALVNGNGNKGRVFALGPSATWSFSPKIAMVAKVEKEFAARNKSEGTRWYLQFRMPIWE